MRLLHRWFNRRALARSLWLLSAAALLLLLWQVPVLGLLQRQAGLLIFLRGAWPAEALPGELRPPAGEARLLALRAAARRLQQAGSQVDTDRALGRVALAANQPEEAEQYLQRRLENAPDDVLARYFLGEAYLQQGRVPEVVEQWAAAGASGRLSSLAGELIKDQQPEQALAALEAVIALEPANVPARQQAGDLWRKQGDPARAAALYGEIITIAPDKATGYVLTGNLLLEQGRYEEAAASFLRALERSETAPQGVLVSLGRAYTGQGRWAEAAAAYDQAVRISPAQAGVYVLLGQARCQLGQAQAARLAFEQAIQLGSQNSQVRQAVEIIAQYGICPGQL